MAVEFTMHDLDEKIRKEAEAALAAQVKPLEERIAAELGEKFSDVIEKNEEVRQRLRDVSREAVKTLQAEENEARATPGIHPLDVNKDYAHPYVRMAGSYMRNDNLRTANGELVNYHGRGLRAIRYLRASLHAMREHMSTGQVLRQWGDDWFIREIEADIESAPAHVMSRDARDTIKRALGTNTPASGGTLVPPSLLAELVDILRGQSVFLNAGPQRVPMPNGKMDVPRATGDLTVSSTNEFGTVNESSPTTGLISLVLKKLMSITVVSNEMLATPDASADAFIRNMVTEAHREQVDRDSLTGDGTANTVVGMSNQTASGTPSASSDATPTVQQAVDDFVNCISRLAVANVTRNRPAWFLNPRTVFHLIGMRTTDEDPAFPALESQLASLVPTFYGAPMYMTTHVPANLTPGTATEILYAEMNDVYYGFRPGGEFVLELLPNATYLNSSGTMVSGVSEDSSVFRGKCEHEIQMRHTQAVTKVTSVLY